VNGISILALYRVQTSRPDPFGATLCFQVPTIGDGGIPGIT